MNTRYVIFLFYDIPNNSKEENYRYTKFRKYIISIGFIMLQESVYIKNIKTKEKYVTIKRDLRLAAPPDSNVRSLLITEKNYNNLDLISGSQTFEEKIISKKTRIIEL